LWPDLVIGRIIVSDKIVVQPESIDPAGRNDIRADADTLPAAIASGPCLLR